jgi:hypothetical protein
MIFRSRGAITIYKDLTAFRSEEKAHAKPRIRKSRSSDTRVSCPVSFGLDHGRSGFGIILNFYSAWVSLSYSISGDTRLVWARFWDMLTAVFTPD